MKLPSGESTLSISSLGSRGIITDLGQRLPIEDIAYSPTTQEEVEWARELGATTPEEVIDLVRKHKESLT